MTENNNKFSALQIRHFIIAAMLAPSFSTIPAIAETSRGFIGPLEYQLPGNMAQPINILVQYGFQDRARKSWDASGSKVGGDDVKVTVGLTKYVHAWTLESNPNINVGWEVIAPLVGVRNDTARTTASGLADPIAGGFAWFKPTPETTIGSDFLFQLPVGSSSVGGGDRWRIIQSVFGAIQSGAFNYTADLVWDWPGTGTTTNQKSAMTWSTQHRMGYAVTPLFMPYVGLDYEYQKAKNGLPSNNEAVANLGMMFTFKPTYNLAVHYGRGFKGDNRSVTDSVNARFVFVF